MTHHRALPVRLAPVAVAVVALVAAGGLLGCAAERPAAAPSPGAAEGEPTETASESSAPAPSEVAESAVVVFLGDSLTAGYGLDEDQAFPSLVEAELRRRDRAVRVVNAGVSGDTTAGGLARLDWLLRQEPDVVVVALGGNDGLRGVDLTSTEANLRAIVEGVRAAGARVLLAGMQIPPNYGEDYTRAFADLYPRVAATLDVPLLPFLLEGVAGDPRLNQPDGIHPTAEGQEILAETVLSHLLPILDRLDAERSAADEGDVRNLADLYFVSDRPPAPSSPRFHLDLDLPA